MYGNVSNSVYKKNLYFIFEFYFVSIIYKIWVLMMIIKKYIILIRLYREEIVMIFFWLIVSEIEDICKKREFVK